MQSTRIAQGAILSSMIQFDLNQEFLLKNGDSISNVTGFNPRCHILGEISFADFNYCQRSIMGAFIDAAFNLFMSSSPTTRVLVLSVLLGVALFRKILR